MILHTLKLNHFKQYGNLELDFKEGLVGIVGRNGAGKSSVFEAVLLCLFGDIKLDKNYFRSSWATSKDPVVLDLDFEVKGKRYRILREFRGKALAHQAQFYDQEEKSLAAGAKPVTEAVTELLGMDKDSFTRSIFSGQKELGEISNTKGEERRKMIRKMVGLDKLDKIQNIIREDRNKNKHEIKGQENLLYEDDQIIAFQKELKAYNKELTALEKKAAKTKKEFDEKQKLYLAAQKAFEQQNEQYKQHNELFHQLNKFEGGIENFKAQSNDYKARIKDLKELEKSLKKIKPQIESFEKQKAELQKIETQKSAFEQINTINQKKQIFGEQLTSCNTKITTIEKETKATGDIEKELKTISEVIQKETERITKGEQLRADLNTQIGAIQGKISDRNSSIQNITKLGKEAECPTCFQPLLSSYDQTIARLQSDIAEYETKQLSELNSKMEATINGLEKIKQSKNNNLEKESKLKSDLTRQEDKLKIIVELKAEQKSLTEQIAQFDQQIKSLGKVSFDPTSYQTLKDQIQAFEKTYIKYHSQVDDVAKIPSLEEKNNGLIDRIKKGQTAVKDQQVKIKTLGFKEKQHEAAMAKQQSLEKERDAINEILTENKDAIYALKSSIQEVDNKIKHNEKILSTIKTQRDELQQLESLDVLFSKFKTNILERVKPVISHHASHLFNQITKGRYESIKVDNNFEFHIFDNGDYYPITRFSGGEIDLANLCLRIGISKAISDLSGSSAANSLLCFDEIFGSQDEERRYEILNALDLLKEQYRQIYIISHIESIKDHFPNILQVRKTADGSAAQWT